MTGSAEAWLPAPALSDGALAALVQEQIGGWSRHWLPASSKASSRQTSKSRRVTDASGGCQSSCGRLRISFDPSGRIRLASAMLGLRHAWSGSARADLAMLGKAADQAMSDLLARLSGFLGTAGQTQPLSDRPETPDAVAFGIALPGGRLFEIGLDQQAAVAGRKSRINAIRALPPLQSRGEAVGLQTIAIGASAGVGHLDLAELRTLVAGDVLVLDRRVASGFDLTINGKPVSSPRVQVRQDGPTLFLASGKQERGSAA